MPQISFFQEPIPKQLILVLLVVIAIVFIVAWGISLRRKFQQGIAPTPFQMLVGFITDFLDTLGVGSFATTTALFRAGQSVKDDDLPGTLNVGHTLPTILQALIYISVIGIDLWTLWLLIGASVVGSYVGATLVTKLPKRAIQIGMGVALLIAVTFLLMKLLESNPKGGTDLELTGTKLAIGMVGNFVFGAMMTIGVGAYAPIMIMVSLLGMDPKAAFPLMMGSCAFLMPVASYRFVKADRYDAGAALGLTLLGIPGVIIAAAIVKELPGTIVQWLVVAVVSFTACSMIYSAFRTQKTSSGSSEKT